ncbi:type II toxin-antitoxin system PemK/MazF family toxin [Ostreibacterium oceani]|uniref:MazF family transcriptional regulator n=1 Tax=Ostreibacterium oceani TaxID=2654998 RepID=A0A6N7EWY1_9GAMM|nr:type II toxin-antitoxin system PemK/MazF family toxin [Ostreibacterium oceani]MPV86050.1 MazF family transcriptional regulator [Ostreibacterium oceani]
MTYLPDRNDIVWLDFEPTKGKEIGKYRPALILSSKAYSKACGLLICCPISTSIRHTQTEVLITGLDQPSVVASNLIQTLDYRHRKIKFIAKAEPGVFESVLTRLIPLITGDEYLANLTEA